MVVSAMYPGLGRFGCNSLILPPEGPCTYSFNLDFTSETARELDFTTYIQNGAISFVQSVYIDNSANADPITVTAEGTNQSVTIPGGFQAWQPLLLTDDAKITVSTTALAGKYIPFQVVNFPMHPDVWRASANAAPSIFTTTQLPATLGAKTGALSLSVVPNTGTPFPVVGNVASLAADTGNPVKIGGVFVTTLPTPTVGNRVDTSMDQRGALIVRTGGNANTANDGQTNALLFAYGPTGAQTLNVNANYAFNGGSWDRQRGDVNGTVSQPFAMTGSRWFYAAPSGGVTTVTNTTIIAASVGLRNYLTSIDIRTDALVTALDVEIRAGAGGTVLWRCRLPVGAQSVTKTFEIPLPTAANVALVYTTTVASVGVYLNAQGFQSAV